jgi:hypothetical protein
MIDEAPPEGKVIPYVERWHSDVSWFTGTDVAIRGFLFKGNKAAIQALCDRTFNTPSGHCVDVRAASPFVLFALTTTEKLVGDNPSYPDIGREMELSVSVFVNEVKQGLGLMQYSPYVVVDTSLALVDGREVIGIPKEMGVFRPTLDAVNPASTVVDVYGAHRFGTDQAFTLRPLIEVNRVDDDTNLLETLADKLDIFTHMFDDVGVAFQAVDRLVVQRRSPIVALKQFRDVSRSDHACFQSMVTGSFELANFHDFSPLPGSYELIIHDLESHPLQRDLGLTSREHSELSFSARYDFAFKDLETVWLNA